MKRIATVQDISCFGKCSLTVALPIVSAMGVECAVVPTAVLSTHTGGFSGYTFRDLSEDIPKISEHWKSIDLKFDALYTGYLGSAEQIDMMKDLFATFGRSNTLKFVDPAMADNGKLYAGFGDEFPKKMRELCSVADIIVPNMTEATLMLGEDFCSDYSMDYVKQLLKRLCSMGCRQAVLTGVITERDGKKMHGAVAYNAESGEYCEYFAEHIPFSFHGTGDVFSSALCGAMVLGKSMEKSLEIAVEYTVDCIKHTFPDYENHPYGVKFEECIPYLCKLIGEN